MEDEDLGTDDQVVDEVDDIAEALKDSPELLAKYQQQQAEKEALKEAKKKANDNAKKLRLKNQALRKPVAVKDEPNEDEPDEAVPGPSKETAELKKIQREQARLAQENEKLKAQNFKNQIENALHKAKDPEGNKFNPDYLKMALAYVKSELEDGADLEDVLENMHDDPATSTWFEKPAAPSGPVKPKTIQKVAQSGGAPPAGIQPRQPAGKAKFTQEARRSESAEERRAYVARVKAERGIDLTRRR